MYTWPTKGDELFKYVPLESIEQAAENKLYTGNINAKNSSLNFKVLEEGQKDVEHIHPLISKGTHYLEKILMSGSYFLDLSVPAGKSAHAISTLTIDPEQEVLLVLHASENVSHESLLHLSFKLQVLNGARLTVVSLIDLPKEAKITLFGQLILESKAQVFWHHGALTGAFSHVRLSASLKKGSHFATRSCLLSSDNSYHGFQPIVEHTEGKSTCDLQTRALACDTSTVLQHGKINVPVDSGQIEAHYSSDNLSLSKSAKIFARPDLDIATDDVVCSHGVTMGSLNQEHIYYLQSRHLSPSMAKMLLLKSFVMTIFDQFPPQVSLPSHAPDIKVKINKQLGELLEK